VGQRVPELDLPAYACGGEKMAVQAERHRTHRTISAGHRAQRLAGGRVPQVRAAIEIAGDQHHAAKLIAEQVAVDPSAGARVRVRVAEFVSHSTV
jgi:hypothetical protein